ncbi:DUF1877 family protein [Streptomyces sp. NPDC015220]|uniref:DUF1877 family protein n=1 Tax=Streptomyces sp. NPDC015220 TaxID=3364947 RepID=UPI0036FC8716
MGYHVHLIAVREDEPLDDPAWLDRLFSAAWDAEEPSPGSIESVIHKDFFDLDRLVRGSGARALGPEEPASLLIFGGRPVYRRPNSDEPPYIVLSADEVRAAARFAESTDFEDLWAAADSGLTADPPGWGEGEVREMFRDHYARLSDTYRRAAAEGRAVVKDFSF